MKIIELDYTKYVLDNNYLSLVTVASKLKYSYKELKEILKKLPIDVILYNSQLFLNINDIGLIPIKPSKNNKDPKIISVILAELNKKSMIIGELLNNIKINYSIEIGQVELQKYLNYLNLQAAIEIEDFNNKIIYKIKKVGI